MTKTMTLYSASELQEANYRGFERALEDWCNDASDEILWADETIESLKALIEASNLALRDWSLGAYGHSYIKIDWPSDIAELSGNRALAWLENNLLDGLREKRPFIKRVKKYEKWHDFTRYGKIPDCPITGYFVDDVYLEALIKAVKEGASLEDAYNWLADECQKILEGELESVQDHWDEQVDDEVRTEILKELRGEDDE